MGLLSGLGMRLAAYGLLAVGVFSTISFGYHHYQGLVNQNKSLAISNSKLNMVLSEQRNTVNAQSEALEEWAEAQEAWVETVEALTTVADEANRENERLSDIYSKHDLADLAKAKPGLIEQRINRGTAITFSMLECASGSDSADCPTGDNEAGPDAERPTSPTD